LSVDIPGTTAETSITDDDEVLVYDTGVGLRSMTFANFTSGITSTDADAIHDNVASEISAVALKATPASGDFILVEDSEDSNNKKRITIGTLPTGGGGEANTASNAGSGISLFYQKNGIDLEFNGIKSENSLLTAFLDVVTHDIELTLNESLIDHDNLTNTHNLTTDIDHNQLTNTHNLTTSIDHNSITNTHNLTTDIDHDALTNYVADEHIDWTTDQSATNTIDLDNIEIAYIGTPTYDDIGDAYNLFGSAGLNSGGAITDAGGATIDVAAGTAFLRSSDSPVAQLYSFNFSAALGQAIPSDTVRYVGVEYNAGSPQVVISTTNDFNERDEFALGTVVNESGTLHVVNNPQMFADSVADIIHRFYDTDRFAYAKRIGGLVVGETGTRNLTLTAGELYDRTNEFEITAKDTSAADTFDSYYGLTKQGTGITQWDNANYNNAGTLTAIPNNQWANQFVFLEADDSLVLVYGTSTYSNSATAQNEGLPPTLPDRLLTHGIAIAQMTFQEGASSAAAIKNLLIDPTTGSLASTHNNLSGLQGGTTAEYYHLTSSEHTELSTWLDDVILSDGGSVNLGTGVITASGANIDGTATYNTSEADVDFRIASDTLTNAFYLQGSDGYVGFNTSTPNATIDAEGNGALLPAPNAALADGSFAVSQYLFWVDEVNDEVEFKARESGGGYINQTLVSTTGTQTLTNKSIVATQINSGTLPDARIQASGVTQHENSITSLGTLDNLVVTVADTENQTGIVINQNDVTNDPIGLNVVNTGDGNSLQINTDDFVVDSIGNVDVAGKLTPLYLTSSDEYDNGSCSTSDTIDFANGNNQYITLTGACTLTITIPTGGEPSKMTLRVIQGGTGSYEFTYAASVRFAGGVAPTLTDAVGAEDLLVVGSTGTFAYVAMTLADVKVAP